MEKYINIIKNSKLFFNMTKQEIYNVINCLNANIKTYKKGETILNSGDVIKNIAIIIEGTIYLEKEDFLGNKTIFCEAYQNDIFGASYCYDDEPVPFNVISLTNSIVMFLDIKKVFDVSLNCCNSNIKISKNFLYIVLEKNKNLNKKLEHISQRTTRNKLVSYLSEQAFKNKSNEFSIKFNRQQLADYLCIDRSAMSNELSKMRKEKMLDFNKNYFVLNKNFGDLNY